MRNSYAVSDFTSFLKESKDFFIENFQYEIARRASILGLVFLFFSVSLFAQQSVRIEWEGLQKVSDEEKIFKCSPCGYSLPFSQPVYEVNERVNAERILRFEVVVTETEPLTGEALSWVRSWEREGFASLEYGISAIGRQNHVRAQIPLIRSRANGGYELVKSFTYSYQLASITEVASRKTFSPNSVLAQGNWYRVAVNRDGVFRITPQLLRDMGVSGSISSAGIAVFGNRGGMLPERVGDEHIDDLVELPILMVDGGDGVFSGSDYALFYAHGPHRWNYNQAENRYQHVYNIYSDDNFYFIRIDATAAQRISTAPSITSAPNQNVSAFDALDFLEETKVNLQRVGRQWFGDVFDFNLTYNYSFPMPNLVPNSPVNIRMRAAARSTVNGTFMTASTGGTQVLQLNFAQIFPNSKEFATPAAGFGTTTGNGNSVNLTVTYNNQINPAATAWLDFISVHARRQLTMSGTSMIFRDIQSVGAGNITEFSIQNATAGMEIWDVTDPLQTFRVPATVSGNTAIFRVQTDSLRTFVAFRGADFSTPRAVGKVTNQNLHGLAAQDMLIITFPGFRSAAERLARFRESHNGFKVRVVDVQEIYNEFHSGVQDISAIRNFIRSNYVKAPNGAGLKYVCLVGTASYDFKDREPNNTNFVPVYQSVNSFNVQNSFIADDFYGFLDLGEGIALGVNSLNVNVGRLTVRSSSQANAVVDKIIRYERGNDRFGDWRARMLFVTDDVDDTWERDFMIYSDRIIDSVSNRFPFYNFVKVYADAFQQVSTAGSQRYPDVQEEIFRQVQAGALITNFIGHGGEIGWAQEQILRLEEINNWSNIDRLSIFVTITCAFSRFDEVWRTSAGEQTLLNPRGGAVALLSTTRDVGAIPAMRLNEDLFDQYRLLVASGNLSIGEWIRQTKNNSTSFTKISFALLGDPALGIPFPQYDVLTEQMFDEFTQQPTDTIRALGKTRVTGRVAHRNGAVVSDFNGVLDVSVFDKPVVRQTLVNDGVGDPYVFTTQTNAIYRGRVSVSSGRFSFNFITPINIAFQFGPGKFSYYGAAAGAEAAGGDRSPIVGGLDTNARPDAEGPEIQLFMNDESFVFGGLTNENPDIFAMLFDSSGINTVGNSIGHDIVAILDHRTEAPIILNDFYTADLNSFRRGSIRYPLFNLEEGPHHLSLRAWDVHNNPSTTQTEFIVASSAGLALKHVLNYPNPFTTRTLFQFEHNRPNQPLEVLVQIFTVSGRLVKTLQANVFSQGNRVTEDLVWDGLDDFGDPIGKGVYIYRLKVRSTLDDAYAEKMEKLVILR